MRVQRAVLATIPPEVTSESAPVIRHLTAVYDAFINHVEERRELFATLPDQASQKGAVTEMRSLVYDARKLQQSLTWIDAIALPALDLGTRYFIEPAGRRLVSPSVAIVLVPAFDASYSTYSDPYSKIVTDWGNPAAIENDHVAIVFLPRREQRSALLHPLIVHELSHAACKEHQLTKKAFEKALKRRQLQRRFAVAVTEVMVHKGVVERQATLEIGASLHSWLEEALCDALASSYLGPTYLFSFVAEVVAGNLDRAGASHPSPTQRIRLMLKILDANGWAPTMSARVPELTDWLRNVSAGGPTLERELGFLTWVLDTVARDLRKAVDSKFGKFHLSPDAEVLGEIDSLLKVGIPPAQAHSGEAIDPRAIAVGSWFHALGQAGGDIVSIPDAVDSAEIESLLPKGLEMAAQLTAWN